MNPKVDAYFERNQQWLEITEQLRTIAIDCGLTEELKWGKPCYSYQKGNICIIQDFKASCALMFFKGALLKDPKHILERPGENSRVARRIVFTSAKEASKLAVTVKAYIYEAIEVEKSGIHPDDVLGPEKKQKLDFPEEFKTRLANDPKLKKAFEALTPGRQRAYHLHFSQAKQSKTRESRIEKCIPQILAGKGFNER